MTPEPFQWSWWAAPWTCSAAACAAVLDYVTRWRMAPWASGAVAKAFLALVLLDVTFALGALAATAWVPQLQVRPWLWSPFGWVLIGLVAAILIRGNLGEAAWGNVTYAIGFGLLYVPLRQPLHRMIAEQRYITEGKRGELRRRIYMSRSTQQPDHQLLLDRLCAELHKFRDDVDPGSNPAAERAYVRVCRENDRLALAVEQLVDYLIEQRLYSVLARVLGSVSRKELRDPPHSQDKAPAIPAEAQVGT